MTRSLLALAALVGLAACTTSGGGAPSQAGYGALTADQQRDEMLTVRANGLGHR